MSRKKKGQFDPFAVAQHQPTSIDAEEQEQPKCATIEGYYLPQKISAFCEAYFPAEQQTLKSEVFTESRLREFFKAYVLPEKGDPLTLYLDALAVHGFHMAVTLGGEPAIIAEAKYD